MASKSRSPEEWIPFLMAVLDCTPAKPDWNQVAADTGAYKSGKFARQAFNNLRDKYGTMAGGSSATSAPATPKSAKKRAVSAEDQSEDEKKPKRARKTGTPKKPPKKKVVKGDSEDESGKGMQTDGSDDELNGDVTVHSEEEAED